MTDQLQKKTVLIVEDDPKIQDIYKAKLTSEGYGVFVSQTGEEAITYLKSNAPNCILLDIMLPGTLNGFDVLEYVKQEKDLKHIPVIVLTNLDTEEVSAKEIGAEGYLIKTNTSMKDVVDKINEHIK